MRRAGSKARRRFLSDGPCSADLQLGGKANANPALGSAFLSNDGGPISLL
jgi:hypothetical protein